MSCYIVNDRTINCILGWLNHNRDNDNLAHIVVNEFENNTGLPAYNPEQLKLMGKALLAMNEKAYSERYDDAINPRDFNFAPELYDDYQTYKAICCLHYQCSEGSVDESTLHKALEQLANSIARLIVEQTKEYDKAGWGL